MPNVISALTARTQFGQIMERAEKRNERFIVDKRGAPTVIIMSVKDYINSVAPAPAWLKKAWAVSRRAGLNKLTMKDIDAEIRAYRQERRGKKNQAR